MFEGLGSAIHEFFEQRRQEKMRTELMAMDDHALQDIGLTRTELEYREDPSFIRSPADLADGIDRTGRMH
jgi:uncharacterized protein YjiS (DUF1127 family)